MFSLYVCMTLGENEKGMSLAGCLCLKGGEDIELTPIYDVSHSLLEDLAHQPTCALAMDAQSINRLPGSVAYKETALGV